MYTVRYGGKRGRAMSLATSNEFVAVRSRDRGRLATERPYAAAALSGEARRVLGEFDLVARFDSAGVEVLRARARGKRALKLRDEARAVLKKEKAVEFAGRVLCSPRSHQPVVYTENFFVKFDDAAAESRCRRLLRDRSLAVKRELAYARNAFFVGAKEGTGSEVFAIAGQLLAEEIVEACHPELVRQVRRRGAFPPQWHLAKTTIGGQAVDAHASVAAAWPLTEGEGVTIAVIDDGIDIDHEEFRSPGKVLAPRDVTRGTNDPRPGPGDDHGTACAGVACADGRFGASGVAPRARLIPIRLDSGLGSQAEADAFVWAAQNGADVISCSWGPQDGEWWNPNDPVHKQVVPLPDATRLAIEWAIANGRNGRGCVITWAAGNGNESVDNDGYASYGKVIAVAACNDRGGRAVYSDFGKAVWCSFPSSHGEPSLTPSIWTTDRTGTVGYNRGWAGKGDPACNYTNDFGGTSSACPGVAGVAALVLARNPALRWDQVKDILRQACDRIDTAGGKYGADGHSNWYGYGRVNARRAVELAAPARPGYTVTVSVTQDVAIQDLKTSTQQLRVAYDEPLKSLRVHVDIEHTYIGDLMVTLKPPAATGVGAIVLHDRAGGGSANLKTSFDPVSTPALAALAGRKPKGDWEISVRDTEKQDTGKLRQVALEMEL
ncbi:MAG: S8 family serine peptidase [Pseudomonadota bacterium]